jgi:hypothetical protein
MTHPDLIAWIRYVAEDPADNELLELDQHMAGCRDCQVHVRALRALQSNFTGNQQNWTAAEHGRVYRRWRLVVGLKSVAKRAKDYFLRLSEDDMTSLRIVLDRERKLAVATPIGTELTVQLAQVQQGVVDATGCVATESGVVWKICRQERCRAGILVDPGRGKIVVTSHPPAVAPSPQLVLLLPQTATPTASVAEFRPGSDGGCVVAEFSSVPSGSYDLLW